jgi:hypothetical protein
MPRGVKKGPVDKTQPNPWVTHTRIGPFMLKTKPIRKGVQRNRNCSFGCTKSGAFMIVIAGYEMAEIWRENSSFTDVETTEPVAA